MTTFLLPAPAPTKRRWWGWLARWVAGADADPGTLPIGSEELSWGAPGAVPAAPNGSDQTLVELYHHRRLALVRLAVLLVDDLPTAEDVVQDAFAAAYRRHGAALAGVDNPDGYLHRSVVNAARSVLRRRKTFRAAPPRVEYPPATDEGVILAEEHREVLAALGTLPQRQREVLVLRYWSDLSEAQIAETLNISRGTVKSTASRALDALEKLLEARR
ncbi:RNA polymerase sigma factor [Cryptosporangium phraense]|uniref:SigE family RNA polymerase sigma factor n=1 Tax=Cryptosporangium phraense TaxID=2593070 RepID=A0A545AQI1_9ACTN|nr:SigE family RNA polymerase sigma factor [Cryptosporangium phraense]TQS43579.1 SigE family RNA polymerase sigma factor [Cryptosporangium phraense]